MQRKIQQMRSRRQLRSQIGATLIELLVALVVTVLLIGPLSMLFVASLRGSSAADEQLARNGDAQRIGAAWTEDVQNVSVGGVNTGVSCPAPDGFDSEETHLVSFSWNLDSSSSGQPTTATWVAVGEGADLALKRRVCVGGVLEAEESLAFKVGSRGQDVFDTVHGPAADPREFCPAVNKQSNPSLPQVLVSDSCTIQVTGALSYTLEVARRVPDRGASATAGWAPDAPTINDGVGRNQYVTVSWGLLSPPSGQPAIEQYRLFLYTDPNGEPVGNAIVDANSNFAAISELTNGVPYWARVQARNRVGWGSLSDAFGPITPHPTEPEAPTVPAVSPGDHSVIVNWTPNENDGGSPVTSWQVIVIDLNGVESAPVIVTPGTAATGTVNGLTNGKSYRVVVAGVNAIGVGVRSDFSEVFVPYGAPPPAGTVIAQANDAQVTVRWAPPADDNGREIIGYTVRAYQGIGQTVPTSPGGTYFTEAAASCSASACQVTQSVTNGEYYRFTVASRSDVGNGTTLDGSESIASTPFPSPAVQPKNPPYVRPSTSPGKPNAPTASVVGTTTVRTTFTLPANGGEPIERAYVNYRRKSTAAGAQYEAWTSANSQGFAITGNPGDSRSVDFTGAAGYIYQVQVAVANKGEWFSAQADWRQGQMSSASGEVTVAGNPTAPGAPSVTRNGSSYPFAVNVSLSAPSNNGGACIDQYQIDGSADGSNWSITEYFPSSPNCTQAALLTSSTISNILAGQGNGTWSFRVRAHNSTGWSAYSSNGSTTALRQECTLTATENKTVELMKTKNKGAYTSPLRVQYSDSKDDEKDRWSYVKFDQRSTSTSTCSEFGLALPGGAIADGRPAGYSADSMPATASVLLLNRTSGPSGGKVAVHQANGGWTEGGLSWDNKPGRANETDNISGGPNGYRWWWVDAAYSVNQRNDAARFGWILGQKDGGDEWNFEARTGSNPPRLKIRFR